MFSRGRRYVSVATTPGRWSALLTRFRARDIQTWRAGVRITFPFGPWNQRGTSKVLKMGNPDGRYISAFDAQTMGGLFPWHSRPRPLTSGFRWWYGNMLIHFDVRGLNSHHATTHGRPLAVAHFVRGASDPEEVCAPNLCEYDELGWPYSAHNRPSREHESRIAVIEEDGPPVGCYPTTGCCKSSINPHNSFRGTSEGPRWPPQGAHGTTPCPNEPQA